MDEISKWLFENLQVMLAIATVVATGVIAFTGLKTVNLQKQVVDKQVEFEDQKNIRLQWEHTKDHATWLTMSLQDIELREQIDRGPIIEWEQGVTARVKGYKVNGIDLSENTPQFQISDTKSHRKKKYPSLRSRLNDEPRAAELLNKVTGEVLKENHATIEILYVDMGSRIDYKRNFYFNLTEDREKLTQKPKDTIDPPFPCENCENNEQTRIYKTTP